MSPLFVDTVHVERKSISAHSVVGKKVLNVLLYASITPTVLAHEPPQWLGAWDTLTMFEATVCGRS